MFNRKNKKMSCEENREMINSLVDAELSQAEKEMLEKHLSVCTKCRTLQEWLRCVKEGISRSAESLTIPSSFRDKVLAALPDTPPRQEYRPWWKRLFRIS
jgi:anti-sigma factor RsiW